MRNAATDAWILNTFGLKVEDGGDEPQSDDGDAKFQLVDDPETTKIRSSLQDDGFAGVRRRGHLEAIVRDLDALPAGRVNQIIDELTPKEIQDFDEALNANGVVRNTGLSGTERRKFFDKLAAKAGAPQLGKLSDGFSEDDKQILASAVAAAAPDETKIGYVKVQSPKAVQKPDALAVGNISILQDGDAAPDARALATVLASLKGKAADAGFAIVMAKKPGGPLSDTGTPLESMLATLVDLGGRTWSRSGTNSMAGRPKSC